MILLLINTFFLIFTENTDLFNIRKERDPQSHYDEYEVNKPKSANLGHSSFRYDTRNQWDVYLDDADILFDYMAAKHIENKEANAEFINPDSPLYNLNDPKFHPFWKIVDQKLKILHQKIKPKQPGITSLKYEYPKDTPLLTNSELKNIWLSREPKDALDASRLQWCMTKRRHLLEMYGHIHWNRVVSDIHIEAAYSAVKEQDINLFNKWKLLRGKINAFRYRKDIWEEWKEKLGYYSHYEMDAKEDYKAILTDIRIKRKLEKFEVWSTDSFKGLRHDRVLHVDYPKQYEGRTDPLKAHNAHLKLLLKVRDWEVKASLPMWQFHNLHKYKQSYIYPTEDFVYKVTQFYHLYALQAYKDIPQFIKDLRLFKGFLNQQRRVSDTWKFVLHPEVPFKAKLKAFLRGDFTFQNTVPVPYQSEDADLSIRYQWGVDGPKKNWATTTMLEKLRALHPYYRGNQIYLDYFYYPYRHLRNQQKASKLSRSKDVFWFKFDHKEYLYTRRIDHTPVREDCLDSGGFHRHLERFKRRSRFLWEVEMKERHDKADYEENLELGDDKLLWDDLTNKEAERRLRMNAKITWNNMVRDLERASDNWLPDGFWLNYYEYKGPNFYQNFGIKRNQKKYIFFGPSNMNLKLRYKLYAEHWAVHNYISILYNLWLPGISSQYLFYINDIFLMLIFFFFTLLGLIYYLTYTKFIYGAKFMKAFIQNPEFKNYYDDNNVLVKTELVRMVDKPVEEAEIIKKNHKIAWTLCCIFFALFFLLFYAEVFPELKYYSRHCWENWLIYTGSSSVAFFTHQSCKILLASFYKYIEEKVGVEKYQKAWAAERQATEKAEYRLKQFLLKKHKELNSPPELYDDLKEIEEFVEAEEAEAKRELEAKKAKWQKFKNIWRRK